MFEKNKNKINSFTNWIFASLVLLVIIAVIAISQIGKKQDSIFEENYQMYNYAIHILDENQASEAKSIFEQLVGIYPNRPYLLWNYGRSLAMNGEYEQAIEIYQKALKQRPFLIKNPAFTQSIGEIYYYNNEFEKAKVYLEYCLTLEITPEQEQEIKQMLFEIEGKL